MFEWLSPEPIYNTRAVVQRTSVPADTFRAWERRYGVPKPTRTPGNQRLYSERDIALIGWLRDQTSAGMTISHEIALLYSQARASAKNLDFPPCESDVDNAHHRTGDVAVPYGAVRDRLVDPLVQLDGTTADRIVGEAFALASVENICLRVLQSALIEIGDRWEHGAATVAVEHFASAYVQRKLGTLFNQSDPSDGRGPIIAACPEGELHDTGLLLTCVFLSRRGYRILFLGANTPHDDLVTTIDRIRPTLLLLSATRDETVLNIRCSIPRLKAAARNTNRRGLPEIGFGGRAFADRPDLAVDIDGTYLGADAREAADNVERVFAALPV